MVIKIVDLASEHGGSFQFVMWMFPRGYAPQEYPTGHDVWENGAPQDTFSKRHGDSPGDYLTETMNIWLQHEKNVVYLYIFV